MNRFPRRVDGVFASAIGVGATFLVALIVYVRTLLPGPSFGDWAEMQWIPAVFGIPHPTGYPLYLVVGKLFSFVPIGSVAYRADLLSAITGAGVAATAVAIALRLDVRPFIAAVFGITLAVTATLWSSSTIAEVNALHALLVALLIHRALVWRQERRPGDLRLTALFGGLAFANHGLAISVVPTVALFLAWDARRELWRRPVLVAQCLALGCVGLALYAVIPLRALVGPQAVYGSLLTWDGFSSLVTGAQFRSEMHFGTVESLRTFVQALPAALRVLVEGSNAALLVAAAVGELLLLARRPWLGVLFLVLVASNLYLYANYVGDLDHYLLITWLIIGVCAAVTAEKVVRAALAVDPRLRPAQVLLVIAPLAIGASNWVGQDLSADRGGEAFVDQVFASLPADSVLLTYWDALTTLSYAHCVAGERPDIALRAYDQAARVTCDDATESLADVVRRRPLFALFALDGQHDPLRDSFHLVAEGSVLVPYGHRRAEYEGTIYRLQPRDNPP